MGLDFSRPQAGVQTAVLDAENEVQVVEKYEVSACTDITGFGLLGH